MDANIPRKPMATLITSYFMGLTYVGYFKVCRLEASSNSYGKMLHNLHGCTFTQVAISSIVFITIAETNILNFVMHF
jgi:hypothetical protein